MYNSEYVLIGGCSDGIRIVSDLNHIQMFGKEGKIEQYRKEHWISSFHSCTFISEFFVLEGVPKEAVFHMLIKGYRKAGD